MAETIAVIGAGNIGGPMARRLLRCGFALIVCDLRDSVLDEFRVLGARVTRDAADCAAADTVIALVATGAQLEEATAALLRGVDPARPCRLVVMSTVAPQAVVALQAACAEKGVALVDAPVSGGAAGAERGTLSIVAGGGDAMLAPLRPLFDSLGTLYRAGPLGSGMAVKIVNNILGVANLYLTAEALQLVRPFGLAMKQVADIMEHSSGRNAGSGDLDRYRRAWGAVGADAPHMRSAIDISTKDLSLALELATQAGVATPLVAALRDGFAGLGAEQVGGLWKSLGGEHGQ
jgi:3-hydroxyisobutyrate dehydrogenase-like beta-hydroxyacid dehydrogenase